MRRKEQMIKVLLIDVSDELKIQHLLYALSKLEVYNKSMRVRQQLYFRRKVHERAVFYGILNDIQN